MTAGRPERFRIGELILDVEAGEVRREGRRLTLPPRTFELLVALVRHFPATARRTALLDEVWPDEFVSDQTLTHRVMVLRKALGDHAESPEYVASDRGWGYRLVAAVEKLDAPKPDAAPEPAGPGRGGLAVTLLVLALTLWSGPGHLAPPPTHVAIRPFVQRVSPAVLEVFGDELSDELAERLLRLPGVELVTWSEKPPPPLWFEGHIEGSGDRLRLRLRLRDDAGAPPLWARDVAGSYYELRSREARILYEATAAVRDRVGSAEACALTRPASSRVERLCLRGELFWLSWSDQGLRMARECWGEASAVAPDHAPAVAGLSLTGSVEGMMGYRAAREAGDEAETLARRALANDPTLPAAHLALGLVLLLYRGELAGAERSISRAREMAPEDLAPALGEALLLQAQGRFAQSLEVLPAPPGPGLESAAARLLQGRALTVLGRLDEAETHLVLATRLGSPPAAAFRALAEVRARLGRDEAALEALRREARLRGSLTVPEDLPSAWEHLCETGVLTPGATVRACQLARRCASARRILKLGLAERQPFATLARADPRYRGGECDLGPG